MIKPKIDLIIAGLIECAGSRNLPDVLSELNIVIKRVSANRPILHGENARYVNINGKGAIYLSTSCPEEEERFVLAHEIGHAVLHDEEIAHYGLQKRGMKEEEEADYFAVKLLGLKAEPLEDYTIKDYASLFGVKEEAVEYIVGDEYIVNDKACNA